MGMQNLTKAQTVIEDVVASESFFILVFARISWRELGEAWGVVKENVTAVLAPAKDVVLILDSVTKYIPAVMVAESVLSVRDVSSSLHQIFIKRFVAQVIIKHELERHENDKNIVSS